VALEHLKNKLEEAGGGDVWRNHSSLFPFGAVFSQSSYLGSHLSYVYSSVVLCLDMSWDHETDPDLEA